MTSTKMIPPREVMERLNLSYPTLLRRVKANDLPYVKVGHKLLFTVSYFEKLEEQAYQNLKGGSNE